MKGRPKEFDRDKALEKAMNLFWCQGYEATGIRDLLEHMEIGRQSLYDTFGSKHDLFVEALKHYAQGLSQRVQAHLDAPGSPLEKIRAIVQMWGQGVSHQPCPGCLINNSAIELSQRDPVVAHIVGAHLQKLEQGVQQVLERAVETGELSAEADPRALARFFTSTLQGLLVMGKAGMKPASIQDVVDVALSVLK